MGTSLPLPLRLAPAEEPANDREHLIIADNCDVVACTLTPRGGTCADKSALAAALCARWNAHDGLVEALRGLCTIATHPKATKADIRMIAVEARAILAAAEAE